MLNVVIIQGNLTRDPESKITRNDKSLANCGLAHNKSYKDKNTGEWIKKPVFVDFVVFGTQADNFAKACSKGSAVTIEGELDLDQWEKDGKKFSKLKIKANRIHWPSAKKESSAREYEAPPDRGGDEFSPF